MQKLRMNEKDKKVYQSFIVTLKYQFLKKVAFFILILLIFGCEGKSIEKASKDLSDSQKNSPITYKDHIFDIDFVNHDNGWVVGYWGGIFYTQDAGKTWVRQESKTKEALYGVSFTDLDNGWVVGDEGVILHTKSGGKDWEFQESGTQNALFKVKFVNRNKGLAVGYWGTILYTDDGGRRWEKVPIKGDTTFYDTSFVDDNNGWMVGEFGSIYYTKRERVLPCMILGVATL